MPSVGGENKALFCFVNASLKAYTYLFLCGVGYMQGKQAGAELHLSSGRLFTKYLASTLTL